MACSNIQFFSSQKLTVEEIPDSSLVRIGQDNTDGGRVVFDAAHLEAVEKLAAALRRVRGYHAGIGNDGRALALVIVLCVSTAITIYLGVAALAMLVESLF